MYLYNYLFIRLDMNSCIHPVHLHTPTHAHLHRCFIRESAAKAGDCMPRARLGRASTSVTIRGRLSAIEFRVSVNVRLVVYVRTHARTHARTHTHTHTHHKRGQVKHICHTHTQSLFLSHTHTGSGPRDEAAFHRALYLCNDSRASH